MNEPAHFDLAVVILEQLRLVIVPLAPAIVAGVRRWLVGKPKWVPVVLCMALGTALGVAHQYAAAAASGQIEAEPWVGAVVGLVLAAFGNKVRDLLAERGERMGSGDDGMELTEPRGGLGL